EIDSLKEMDGEFQGLSLDQRVTTLQEWADSLWLMNTNGDMYWNNGNRVGIGTDSPNASLEVRGESGISANRINFRNLDGGADTDDFYIVRTQHSADENTLDLYINDNGNESFRIFGGSCLTGDCQNPSTMAHEFIANGNAYHRGSVTAANFPSNSDRTLKHSIRPLDHYGLTQIMQLKPVSYILKKDVTGTVQLGLIAQDVKKVIPEIVSGEEGNYSLNYDRIAIVLINAVKELKTSNEKLALENRVLQKKMASLSHGKPGSSIAQSSQVLLNRIDTLEKQMKNMKETKEIKSSSLFQGPFATMGLFIMSMVVGIVFLYKRN
ncbi:MAG: hypothetical protein GY754_18370, partial [bacterium]|nr:hypothetical protein [bacterium]